MLTNLAKFAVLVAISTQAHSQVPRQTFTFCQEGYAEGAFVSGSFTGADDDTNGQLAFGEVTDMTVTFSGNSIVGPLSFDFSNFNGLVYDLDGGPLGDGTSGAIEGIAAFSTQDSFFAGPGPLGTQCGIGIDCAEVSDGTGTDSSQELISINPTSCGTAPPATPVPALPIWALWILAGITGLIGSKRLRKAT